MIVAKVVDEKRRSIQFIKNPLSNNSSSIDSIKTIGIIDKKSNQFPFRSPNFEDAFSDELSGVIENGKLSLMISKATIEIITAPSIIIEIPKVLKRLFGFT